MNICVLCRRAATDLFWLYIVILVPTLAFKTHYLNRLVVGGTETLARELLSGRHSILLYGGDFFEVAAISAAIYGLARLLASERYHIVLIGITIALYLTMFANWVSASELATLLTTTSLTISLSWVLDNPEHIKTYVHGRKELLLFLLTGAAFLSVALVPAIVSKITANSSRILRAHLVLLVLAFGTALAVAATSYAVSPRIDGERPVPVRGYWTSTIRSLTRGDDSNLLAIEVPNTPELLRDYQDLVYPGAAKPRNAAPLDMNLDRRRRHVVVISLETAPGPYYPILNNPDLPNFTRMSQAGISTKRHYSNTPFTTWAVYTMLSGTYPAPGGRLAKYGPFRTDGLANVLQGQGYQTTFIDSYKIDWVIGMQTHQFTWRHLGFDNLVDNADSEYVKSATSNYDRKVKSEEKSFANALTAITRAESEKKHAVVFLATLLGHYKWPAPPGQECEPAETKLERIASVYDRLIGEFMDNLERAALLDDTIIVVTGDHGLRYQNEFESLAADSRDHEAAFNVPFALYAPGIFDSGIELPYVTSHVDITPTLLDLLGVDIAGMYHHGNSMLDPTTADRVTFMMNTQLSPTDWLHWDGNVLSYNNLTDQLRFIRKSESADEFERLMMDRYGSARHLFNAANSHFATSAARSLKLGASEGWDASRAALSSSEEPSP